MGESQLSIYCNIYFLLGRSDGATKKAPSGEMRIPY